MVGLYIPDVLPTQLLRNAPLGRLLRFHKEPGVVTAGCFGLLEQNIHDATWPKAEAPVCTSADTKLQRCMLRTYLHTYIHTYIHSCIHEYMHTGMYVYMYECWYVLMHVCLHVCMSAFMYVSMHACMHACI